MQYSLYSVDKNFTLGAMAVLESAAALLLGLVCRSQTGDKDDLDKIDLYKRTHDQIRLDLHNPNLNDTQSGPQLRPAPQLTCS